MGEATISIDATLKSRLADMASRAGLEVDEFVEALLRRFAEADVRFERGVPVFPRRLGAPTLSVDDIERLAHGDGASRSCACATCLASLDAAERVAEVVALLDHTLETCSSTRSSSRHPSPPVEATHDTE